MKKRKILIALIAMLTAIAGWMYFNRKPNIEFDPSQVNGGCFYNRDGKCLGIK